MYREMRLRTFILSLLLLCFCLGSSKGFASTEFMGLYLQGQRIGVISITTTKDGELKKTVTETRIAAMLLGSENRIFIRHVSWTDSKGKIAKQEFFQDSAGRTTSVTAEFTEKEVKIRREANGSRSASQLAIPEDGPILEDPTFGLLGKGIPESGSKLTYYVFDPQLMNFVKNEAEFKGKTSIKVDEKTYEAHWLVVRDPRATSDIYMNDKGELIIVKSLLGMEIRPLTREEALGNTSYVPSIDMAIATSIRPDKKIEDPKNVSRLELVLRGKELPRLQSSNHQTITRQDDGSYKVVIHPPFGNHEKSKTIDEVKKQQAEFLKESLYLDFSDQAIQELAKSIVKEEINALTAAKRISKHVHKIMRPNAGIGILRDSTEVLKTKEGVCRDYAILATSLMRAAGIPTKLVTGVVYWEEAFYYHAWVEVWTGSEWIALDPTEGSDNISATYIKFSEGNSEDAFLVFTLDGISIEVTKVEHKK